MQVVSDRRILIHRTRPMMRYSEDSQLTAIANPVFHLLYIVGGVLLGANPKIAVACDDLRSGVERLHVARVRESELDSLARRQRRAGVDG